MIKWNFNIDEVPKNDRDKPILLFFPAQRGYEAFVEKCFWDTKYNWWEAMSEEKSTVSSVCPIDKPSAWSEINFPE